MKMTVKNVVFCDFIRPEGNGKHTLLGAAANSLNVASSGPTAINISLFITIETDDRGSFKRFFRCLNPAGKNILNGNIEGEVGGMGPSAIALGGFLLAVDQSGVYRFEWSEDEDVWEEINVLHIRKTELTSPTSASQGPQESVSASKRG